VSSDISHIIFFLLKAVCYTLLRHKNLSHKLKNASLVFVRFRITYIKYHLGCRYASENKCVDLFDGPSVEDGYPEENVLLASSKWQCTSPYKCTSMTSFTVKSQGHIRQPHSFWMLFLYWELKKSV
jgi:hypothetical protein